MLQGLAAVAIVALLVVGLVVGAYFVVDAWAEHEDAQAQRLAQEAALARARGDAEASVIRAGAEASAVRTDALNRQLTAMFPWLVVVVLGLATVGVLYILHTRPAQAQHLDIAVLAELAYVRHQLALLEKRQREVLVIPAEAMEIRREDEQRG
jgi:hypothetical protein